MINYSVFQRLRHSTIASRSKEKCKAIILVKQQEISILVLGENGKEIVAFDEIQFTKDIDIENQIAQFQYFMTESCLSELTIDSICICYSSQHFCILPDQLFDASKIEAALLQGSTIPYDFICNYDSLGFDAKIIYALPKAWKDWTEQVFESSEIVWKCNHTGFIEAARMLPVEQDDAFCITEIENDQLFVGVIKNHNLLFFNRFAYQSENDLLYFCLLAMQQNQMETNSGRLILCGNILSGSGGMEKLERYFGSIEFVKKSHILELETTFEILNHPKYFSLISQISHVIK